MMGKKDIAEWGVGLIALLFGLASLSIGSLSSIPIIAISALFLPPARRFCHRITTIEISRGIRSFNAVALLLIWLLIASYEGDRLIRSAQEERGQDLERTETKNREYLTQNEDLIIRNAERLIKDGYFDAALIQTNKFADFGNEKINKIRNEAQSEIKAQKAEKTTSRLLEELKKLPVSAYQENLSRYQALLHYHPDNAKYKNKVAFYKEKVKHQQRLENADILVKDWKCRTEYGYTRTTGIIKNVSGRRLENVQVVSVYKTLEGAFVESSSSMIEYNPLMPGQSSPFRAIGARNPIIGSCEVSFKTIDGRRLDYIED